MPSDWHADAWSQQGGPSWHPRRSSLQEYSLPRRGPIFPSSMMGQGNDRHSLIVFIRDGCRDQRSSTPKGVRGGVDVIHHMAWRLKWRLAIPCFHSLLEGGLSEQHYGLSVSYKGQEDASATNITSRATPTCHFTPSVSLPPGLSSLGDDSSVRYTKGLDQQAGAGEEAYIQGDGRGKRPHSKRERGIAKRGGLYHPWGCAPLRLSPLTVHIYPGNIYSIYQAKRGIYNPAMMFCACLHCPVDKQGIS